jgi:hypothetical protein
MRFALSLIVALALGAAPVAIAQDPKAPAFPRRMLVVHVADYLYLNPLTHAAPGGADRLRDAATRLAFGLHVPNTKDNDQQFLLTDAPATDARLPTKDALAKALDGFCSTTRGQDRVVIYFGAHVIEKDGKAFVVPIDGDPDAVATLLPVADVYAKLKELKAAQKVVIWDVCRTNPERVRGRRDPGPMTPALFKGLTAAPEGVQVLVSCSPGEHATEYFTPRGAGTFSGSAYLDALRQAAVDDRTATPNAMPGDAIPVAALHKAASKLVALTAKGQTPAIAGAAPKQLVAFDPKEAPAKRFEIPAPKGPPAADVKAILDELALPPLLADDNTAVIARLPFSEAALKVYAPDASVDAILRDPDKYPLRVATLRALQSVRDSWPMFGKEQRIATALAAPLNDRTKKAVTDAQQPVAKATAKLEFELTNLLAQEPKRAKETKRWQAHHDYTLAEVRLRLVLLNEYNRALGHVRTEALPDLPAGATGWRLGPSVKIEGRKEAQALFNAATDGFARVAADHKGTPWEALAKRSQATLPGARWEPVLPPKDGK